MNSGPLLPPKLLFTRVLRRWALQSGNRRLRTLVRNRLRKWCVDRELVVRSRNGFRIGASPQDYASYGIYFFDEYDADMTNFLKAHIHDGCGCYDVGTDRGWFSLLMGRLVGPSGRVDAFEAYPRNYERLSANIALNNFGWVHAYQLAVSKRTGRMHFVPPSNAVTYDVSFLETCSGVGHLVADSRPGGIEVQTVTLDQHAEEQRIDRLCFIKMDIEGAEVDALRGAEHTIKRFRPRIAVEYNRDTARRAGTSIEELDDLLDSFGYDRFTFFGRLERLNLEKWKDRSDIETVFNVYCLPRSERGHC